MGMRTKQLCPRSLLVGVTAGVLSVLLGVGVAHADCGRGSYEDAKADAYEGTRRGLRCEVIEALNGTFESQCDEIASPDTSAACDAFVDATYPASLGLDSESRYYLYEACMTIAFHTDAVHQ